MKFLCRNCKAKYQIADEKVAGRTLRMACQQCGEQIVVRGPGARPGGVARAISQPLSPIITGAPPAPAAPSALGLDFKRQVAATGHEAPAARAADEWHVAINDVPVGPMRREEVARKIVAGAVDRESLAWREGMDDWLPVKHIPELAVLIAGPAMPPPPPASSVSMMPAGPLQPAARVEMAPIGGRQVLTLDDYAPPSEMAVVQSLPDVAPETKQQPTFGWGPIFLLFSAGAFIMLVGALMAKFLLLPQQQQQQARVAAPVVAEPAPRAAPAPAQDDQGNVIQLDMQAIDGTSGTRRAPGASVAATDKNKPAPGKQLTDAQKEMLARMGGSLNDQGPNLHAPTEAARPSAASGSGAQLTAGQLNDVVLRGRKNLQRCYETALRGAGSQDTVRLDVDVEVSPAGNVTSVHTTGKGLPGMEECITRTVKMWRFPNSGEGAATRFPVVFQPGA